MSDIAIKIENLSKVYKLGTIGGQTLNAELQSWWARKRGKEDPNLKLGQDYANAGESFYALDGINLEVYKGEAVGIIGANGAGKSTLLKILSRVTAPTDGDIWMNGRISSMLEVGTGFHRELTGRENIYMNGAILGMSKKEVDSKINSIIDFSECRQFIDTPVKRYSSGMYVKLAFAVASHLNSEIMVMDEVLAVGDMKFQQKCLGKMEDESVENGRTILYVSHNMATIRQLCTRCIVLDKGKIIYNGDVEQAINVYMDSEKDKLTEIVNFKNSKRGGKERTQFVEMETLKFKTGSGARFSCKEGIAFSLFLRFKESLENLSLFMQIMKVDRTKLGVTWSEPIICGNAGEEKELSVKLDSLNLCSGIYRMQVWLVKLNDYGTGQDYDKPLEDIFIEIVETDKHSIVWRNGWGPVKFASIDIKS